MTRTWTTSAELGASTASVRVSAGIEFALPVASGAPSAPTPVKDPLVDEEVETDLPWDVIVWDDPVNLMSYVVYVLRKVFGFDEPIARKLMLEIHNTGRALVASESRDKALGYVERLHGHGLQATMERSS